MRAYLQFSIDFTVYFVHFDCQQESDAKSIIFFTIVVCYNFFS